jgi:nucleoside-diphosphate-sugar epimerase
MKIFLTGATGFIGGHFLRSPAAQGHDVVALRRHESGKARVLPLVEPRWITAPLDAVCPAHLAGCDAVVHLASPGVSPQKAEWAELLDANVVATIRLAELARQAGVRRLVVAGTCAEYGRSADRFDPIPPDAPLEPTQAYAASKAAGFAALHAYAIEHGLELAYLRIFSAYGESQYEQNFWPALRRAALAGEDFPMTPGEQVRDFIAVEDVASAFWRAATTLTLEPGRPFVANLGSGQPMSMRAFAERWWSRFQATGRLIPGALPYRTNEVMRFVPLVTPL